MSSYVSAEIRRFVSQRADRLCEYCLVHEDDTFFGCQVDHVVSEKHGGLTAVENLAYACAFCNRHKGTDLASISPKTGQLVRLFSPRADRWRDHFRLEHATIVPLTDVGEATANLLRLNAIDRIVERTALVEAERYPSPAARTRAQG